MEIFFFPNTFSHDNIVCKLLFLDFRWLQVRSGFVFNSDTTTTSSFSQYISKLVELDRSIETLAAIPSSLLDSNLLDIYLAMPHPLLIVCNIILQGKVGLAVFSFWIINHSNRGTYCFLVAKQLLLAQIQECMKSTYRNSPLLELLRSAKMKLEP